MKVCRSIPQGLALAAQSPEFWRRLAPGLNVSDTLSARVVDRDAETIDRDRMRLTHEGYLHLRQPGIVAPYEEIASAMQRIVEAGLPPAFIGVYDEVWAIAAQLQGVLDGMFAGRAALVPDFWATFTDAGDAGMSAKRKRPGRALNADRTPCSLSVWLPLTEANTENGCIYVVPGDQDRNYATADSIRADARLQSIKALPARPGDVLVWTGETYTWQARASRHWSGTPQMAINWEFQDATSAPYEDYMIDSFPTMPFEMRLGLIAEQMPRYGQEMLRQPTWRAVTQTLLNRFRHGTQLQTA